MVDIPSLVEYQCFNLLRLYTRVILRSPYVATDFLKRSQYKQMVGRAGRAGIDTVGESILILQDKDRDMVSVLATPSGAALCDVMC